MLGSILYSEKNAFLLLQQLESDIAYAILSLSLARFTIVMIAINNHI